MRLQGKKVAFLMDEGFEDLEFWVTYMRLREEGAAVTIVSHDGPKTYHGKTALEAKSETNFAALKPADFDAVVVPGGWAPDKMRRYDDVKNFVKAIYDAGKIVGLICHAGLVGISAGVVKGHKATGSLGIKDDLVNAGATWADEPAFRSGNLVWGRVVADIPDFRELVAAIEKP
ncbi:MAG: type 1 glutamine amidotransferase domain-containing protein [Anaerolineae bacterium]